MLGSNSRPSVSDVGTKTAEPSRGDNYKVWDFRICLT